MEKVKKYLDNNLWILVILLGIPAIYALTRSGYFGASDDLHIAWLYEMDRAFKSGQFPPRYVPDLSFGFGYPLFNFVFPFPFYLGEIFHIIGFSFVDSIKIVLGLSILLSGIFFYFFIKNISGKWKGLLSSVIYMYAPYRSTDVYVRGAVGEALSFIFLPLILLSHQKLSEKIEYKWLGIGGLSLAGLILSHNIISYMFFPLLLMFIIVNYIQLKKVLYLVYSASSVLLGLFCSMYFWAPALLDSSLMKYDTVFNYFDHFPTIKQLFTPYFGYGASVPGSGDGMSFYLGTFGILAVMFSIFFILINRNLVKKNKNLFVFSVVTLLISLFMMNYRSTFIWENIPLVKYFQFPWRFLTLTTLTLPIFIIFWDISDSRKKIILILSILIVIVSANMFKPQDFLGRNDNYYINRYIPYPDISEEYLSISEEYLRLPVGLEIRPDRLHQPIYPTENLNIDIISYDGINLEARVESTQDRMLSYSKYNFPGWEVNVNEIVVDNISGKPYGQIVFDVKKGINNIDIIFRETRRNLVFDIISLISILSSLFLVFGQRILPKKYG